MRRVYLQKDWPDSWKASYPYDLQEVYGEPTDLGYALSYGNRMRYTLDLLREVLKPGARVLDIAAAQGNFSLALAELGYDVTWNDLRSDLIDYVRAKHERGAISYAPGNAFDLQFPEPFDAVLIAEVIEHVAHPDEFLASVSKLVKPGGHIVMTTPNGAYFRNKLPKFSECEDPSAFEAVQFQPNSDGHIFLLHEDEVEAFAALNGLKIEKFLMFNNSLTCGHVKLNPLLKALPRRSVTGLEEATQRLPGFLARKLLTHMAVRFSAASH